MQYAKSVLARQLDLPRAHRHAQPMASFFGHAALALTAHAATRPRPAATCGAKRALLAVVAATLPDLDAFGHWAGVPYDSQWGHRGFTHSFTFALVAGLFLAYALRKKIRAVDFIFFSCVATSHSFLDALTNGGRGVALLWPFSSERFFFPWRPIEVSPLSIRHFFTQAGWEVVQSELVWIALPCLAVWLVWHQLAKKTVN